MSSKTNIDYETVITAIETEYICTMGQVNRLLEQQQKRDLQRIDQLIEEGQQEVSEIVEALSFIDSSTSEGTQKFQFTCCLLRRAKNKIRCLEARRVDKQKFFMLVTSIVTDSLEDGLDTERSYFQRIQRRRAEYEARKCLDGTNQECSAGNNDAEPSRHLETNL